MKYNNISVIIVVFNKKLTIPPSKNLNQKSI